MNYTEKQDIKRYKILFNCTTQKANELRTSDRTFTKLTYKKLLKLIDLNYIQEYDSDGSEENIVSLQQLIKLLEKDNKLLLGGLIFKNEEYRNKGILINSVYLPPSHPEYVQDLISLKLFPDLLEEQLCYYEENNLLHKVRWWYVIIP